MEFNDKVVAVTGAGSGFGKEIAILFAKNGYKVICLDVDEPSLNESVLRIKEEGGQVDSMKIDITKVSDIKNLVNFIEEKIKKIDILINCAGILGADIKDTIDFRDEEIDLILNVNLKGTVLCCKYLLPIMIRNKKGVIINIASAAGKIGCPGASVYTASKWGVIGFTKSLNLEVRKHGIKVSVISPASAGTAFHEKRKKEQHFDEATFKKLLKPGDVARACLFVSEQSEFCFIPDLDLCSMSEKVLPVVE